MNKIIIAMLLVTVLNINISVKVFGNTHIEGPTIQSEAAILIEENSGKVIYQKNSKKKMYPASLTKIATAIYALEKGNVHDITIVSKNATLAEGTSIYLQEGEQISLLKLIQGLLINSGNDAGIAIAEHMNGSVETFSSKLNEYLVNEIGVYNTTFKNPHGLFNENHLTTAEDLAKITRYAMKNEQFRRIFGTRELNWQGQEWETILYTHHRLMRGTPYEGITGGKTGYVDQSGHTLVTSAKRGNVNLIAVTLKGFSQSVVYNDTIQLFDYGFNNFETMRISKRKTFMINNTKYKVPRDYYYTFSKGETPTWNVTKKGTLEILKSNKDLLASFNLEKKTQKQDSEPVSKEKSITTDYSTLEQHLSRLIFFSIAIFLIIIVFLYRNI